jgi:hypothetical protein
MSLISSKQKKELSVMWRRRIVLHADDRKYFYPPSKFRKNNRLALVWGIMAFAMDKPVLIAIFSGVMFFWLWDLLQAALLLFKPIAGF